MKANGDVAYEVTDLLLPDPITGGVKESATNPKKFNLDKWKDNMEKTQGAVFADRAPKKTPAEKARDAVKYKKHKEKIAKERAAEFKKDPSQGRYPPGTSNRGSD